MNASNKDQKMQEIYNSHVNGQTKKLIEQIKKYGIEKFHIDFMYFLSDRYPNHMAKYARVIHKFHLAK